MKIIKIANGKQTKTAQLTEEETIVMQDIGEGLVQSLRKLESI